jgi:4-alpha-glucanotransferase
LYDIIRIDHFRALVEYWEVPPGEETAKNGIWKQGPGGDFLEVMDKTLGKLPFLAEDLGDVDQKVFALRDQFKLPGMKVLQFAFGEEMPVSPHIPHNYTKNFIVYTGTHDNNTVKGWYRTDADELVKNTVQQYLARTITEEEIADNFIRMAYSSVAQVAILPIQDILGLDESARMNTPSQAQNNWTWRLLPNQVTQNVINKLQEYLWIYLRQ